MKIIITGSLGHISQPLAKELVEKGHTVTVISSKAAKKPAIESIGAIAAIGSLEDVEFLKTAFTGADAVYTMIPPPTNFFDPELDVDVFFSKMISNYVQAIKHSGIKRVVHLSSIGAHMEKDSGLIMAYHRGEAVMTAIPGISLTIMRPTAFFYNLLSFIPVIKSAGMIMSNYGAEDMISWVSPVDIAAAITEELLSADGESKIRYVASQELTGNEVAAILGAAIGKPELKWIVVSDKEMLAAFTGFGMPESLARGLIEMNSKMHTGELFEDYYQHKPALMGKVQMATFAKEFAAVYS